MEDARKVSLATEAPSDAVFRVYHFHSNFSNFFDYSAVKRQMTPSLRRGGANSRARRVLSEVRN